MMRASKDPRQVWNDGKDECVPHHCVRAGSTVWLQREANRVRRRNKVHPYRILLSIRKNSTSTYSIDLAHTRKCPARPGFWVNSNIREMPYQIDKYLSDFLAVAPNDGTSPNAIQA